MPESQTMSKLENDLRERLPPGWTAKADSRFTITPPGGPGPAGWLLCRCHRDRPWLMIPRALQGQLLGRLRPQDGDWWTGRGWTERFAEQLEDALWAIHRDDFQGLETPSLLLRLQDGLALLRPVTKSVIGATSKRGGGPNVPRGTPLLVVEVTGPMADHVEEELAALGWIRTGNGRRILPLNGATPTVEEDLPEVG